MRLVYSSIKLYAADPCSSRRATGKHGEEIGETNLGVSSAPSPTGMSFCRDRLSLHRGQEPAQCRRLPRPAPAPSGRCGLRDRDKRVIYGGGGELAVFIPLATVRLVISDHSPAIDNLSPWPCRPAGPPPPSRCARWNSARAWACPISRKNAYRRLAIDTAPGKGTRVQADFGLF